MRFQLMVSVAVCLEFFCIHALRGDDYHAQNPGGMKSSAGVANDWLREQVPMATNWDVGGQFRVRYEAKENAGSFPNRDFIRGLDNSNEYFLLRTKLHLGYAPVSWVKFFVEGRDSRAFSDERRPSPDQDRIDLHQAFIVLGDPKEFPFSLKIGRQELSYGDERFIGNSDWGNNQRTFDTARLRYETSAFWVDVFTGRLVIPRDEHFNVANDYDLFSAIYFSSRKLVSWQDTDLYFIVRNVSDGSPNAIAPGIGGPQARDVYTAGARVKSLAGQLKGWDYSAEVAGQFGSINSGGQRLEHRAMAADATLGHTWSKAAGSPRLGLGYTYASGDSNPDDNKNETFDLLSGAHKHYGLMDLWNLRNIHAPRVTASLTPCRKLSFCCEYHVLWLADGHDFFYPDFAAGRTGNGYGRNPQFDSFVGSELDFITTLEPAKGIELQAGYGHFFAGNYIRQSAESGNRSAINADWIYLQGKLTF